MGKPKAPKAPDPAQTAAAQTGTNIGTAIANQTLGNVNQVTPDGALTYSQTGTKQWTDPTSGKVYDLPTYTATQTLSAGQQAIKNQSDKAELNLATLAAGQSAKLNDLLGRPVDTSGAPAAGDPTKIGLPQYTGYGAGPTLQTTVPKTGNVMSSIASGGTIQDKLGNTGTVQTGLANAGNIKNSIANAGNIQTGVTSSSIPLLATSYSNTRHWSGCSAARSSSNRSAASAYASKRSFSSAGQASASSARRNFGILTHRRRRPSSLSFCIFSPYFRAI